jgi:hypothetical protein
MMAEMAIITAAGDFILWSESKLFIGRIDNDGLSMNM